MNVPHSFLMIVVAVAVAALFPLTATAQPPTTVLLAVNDVQVFAGAESPCPFDVTFTGTGTIKLTTDYDNSGAPIRQTVHGALTHTIFSAWRDFSAALRRRSPRMSSASWTFCAAVSVGNR